jgi:hypothetical protein
MENIESLMAHPENALEAAALEDNPMIFSKSYCPSCETLQRDIVTNGYDLAKILKRGGKQLVWVDMHHPDLHDRYNSMLRHEGLTSLPALAIMKNGEPVAVDRHVTYVTLLEDIKKAYRKGFLHRIRKLFTE